MHSTRTRAAALLAALCIFTVTGGTPAAGRGGGPPAGPAPPASRTVFLEKCGRCHEPERAYRIMEDWTTWVLTVARMAVKDRQWIPPEDVRQIIAYHSVYRTHQRSLFQEHCGECHAWERLQEIEKSPSQMRTWIKFMTQRHHGQDLTREECELILCGLVG